MKGFNHEKCTGTHVRELYQPISLTKWQTFSWKGSKRLHTFKTWNLHVVWISSWLLSYFFPSPLLEETSDMGCRAGLVCSTRINNVNLWNCGSSWRNFQNLRHLRLLFNPLSPNSDKHLFSSYNITYLLLTEQEVCMGESWPTEVKLLPYRPTKLG